MVQLDLTIIEIFADVNFVVCFLALKELICVRMLRIQNGTVIHFIVIAEDFCVKKYTVLMLIITPASFPRCLKSTKSLEYASMFSIK